MGDITAYVSSAVLVMNLCIQMSQFDARVGGRELPLHRGATMVAFVLPGTGRRLQCLPVRNAAVGALATEHTELALRNIEPTAVQRRVVQLQTVPEAFGFRRFESLI